MQKTDQPSSIDHMNYCEILILWLVNAHLFKCQNCNDQFLSLNKALESIINKYASIEIFLTAIGDDCPL